MKKASTLDHVAVLELRENKDATGQAIAVLVFTALAIGIGTTLQTEFVTHTVSAYGILVGGLGGVITGCFAAFVWSGTLFLVGTKLFQGRTRFWELARPMFFSATPALLFILVSIPLQIVDTIVAVIASIWVVVLQGYVVKQVMSFNVRRTVLTLAVGFMILFLISQYI
jgi:hypothetical protein